jgi:hypothetical protein
MGVVESEISIAVAHTLPDRVGRLGFPIDDEAKKGGGARAREKGIGEYNVQSQRLACRAQLASTMKGCGSFGWCCGSGHGGGAVQRVCGAAVVAGTTEPVEVADWVPATVSDWVDRHHRPV